MSMTIEERETTGSEGSASRLAAIVFYRDDEPDPPLIAFLEAAARRGARLAGLVQERGCDGQRSALPDVCVRDIVTGETLDIMQDLGRDATGCRVDPAAVAVAAGWLDAARTTAPDLLVVSRFGRLESEGGGMLMEIGQAFADGLPLLICVPSRYLGAWDAFASGLDAKLEPTREAIEAWWAALAPSLSGPAAQ
jgi:hypothetical protein